MKKYPKSTIVVRLSLALLFIFVLSVSTFYFSLDQTSPLTESTRDMEQPIEAGTTTSAINDVNPEVETPAQSQAEVLSKELSLPADKPATDPELSKESLSIIPSDWGTVSSGLGFSLKYPYKEIGAMWGDDEYFQILFYFPPSIISLDKNKEEVLKEDMHNIGLGSLSVTVIKATTTSELFDDWITTYLKKEDHSYSNDNTVLSEERIPTTFAGLQARKLIRRIEGDKEQLSPHFTQMEVFALSTSFIYRISSLASSADTMFPRSGTAGKEYLTKFDSLSKEVLATFVFDESKISSIKIPLVDHEKLSGPAYENRQKLLTALRKEPYYDVDSNYDHGPNTKLCQTELPIGQGTMSSLGGLYFSADDSLSDLHGYEEDGRHTGPLPVIPGFENYAPIEEQSKFFNYSNLGSRGYGLSTDEIFDGRIELVGKKLGQVYFSIRGDGNSCMVASVPMFITPYLIATLPMTKQGDIGPISYDIDGDGTEDLEISLLHPLLPQKQEELIAVLTDMATTEHWEFQE